MVEGALPPCVLLLEDRYFEVRDLRKQFPLHLVCVTTFSGCQGFTLDRTIIDRHTDPFTHGQLYTALS